MASENPDSSTRLLEEGLPSILASLPCVVYRCAPHEARTIHVISDHVEELTGYPAGDFVDSHIRSWRSVIHPEDLDAFDRLTNDAIELGEPWTIVYRIRHKDGSVRSVSERGNSARDQAGTVMFVEGVILDVTDDEKAKRRSRDSERQSRAWLDFSPACTKIVDLDFNLQYMSRAGVESLRIDDISARYGRPYPFDFYPESFRTQMTENLELVRETGEIATQEAAVEDVDGNELWFHSTLVPVHNDNGRVDYIMVVSLDITARKQAEEERLGLERQLLQAEKLKSLGVLSGGVAHDFNNVLTSVLGNVELALHEISPHHPARENVEAIGVASRRGADLAMQMLAYSGKGQFVTGRIDINELITETAQLLETSISKAATLEYDLANNVNPVHGDPTQIRQIIMNLITNASESIADDGGVITLSTGTMVCDRAYLEEVDDALVSRLDEPVPEGLFTYLEVADTGCGMDAETRRRMFDPFFTTKPTGTGLGTSALLGIMEGHRGVIRMHSEVGRGTTFRVLFPAAEIDPTAAATGREHTGTGVHWRGNGTILVAEDEETVRVVAQRMLERLGFSVLTARDGREALELLGEHHDEIVGVLLDLTMPRLDGGQTLRELRRIHGDVPVVLCSGHNMQTVAEHLVAHNSTVFIQKPYDLAGLQAKLLEVMTGTSADTSPTRELAAPLRNG